MKIIVNRGFDKIFTRMIISKSNKETICCPAKQDYCDFDTKTGERIVVKLGYPGTSTFPIASIVCEGYDDSFYICPTKLFKNWAIANYMMLPGLCLLFYILEKATTTDLYDYIFAGCMALWALSLICMGFCQYFPFIQKKMFKTIKL
ncbi:MAG: hypothetical protein PUK67_05475 [Prevotellaceae bacterium]|nr:hypothetical protein [Prevotellaceae bacterium]MDY3365612.1 hypothetical protein [Prevotella sp.]